MRSLTSFPGQRTVGTNADWIQRNQIMWQRRAVARFDFTQHDVCVDVHRPCNRTSVHLFSVRSCTQYGPVVNTRHEGSRSDDDPSKSPIDRAEIASRLVTPLTVLNSLQKKSRFFIARDIRATKEYGNRRLSSVYSFCLTSNVLFEVLDGLSGPWYIESCHSFRQARLNIPVRSYCTPSTMQKYWFLRILHRECIKVARNWLVRGILRFLVEWRTQGDGSCKDELKIDGEKLWTKKIVNVVPSRRA